MLRLLLLFGMVIGLTGCGTYQEMRSKDEYGALQSIEFDHRAIPIRDIQIAESHGYQLAGFPAEHSEHGNVWVLLNPQHPPRFKQMPSDTVFRVSAEALETVRRTPGVAEDILSALAQRVAR